MEPVEATPAEDTPKQPVEFEDEELDTPTSAVERLERGKRKKGKRKGYGRLSDDGR